MIMMMMTDTSSSDFDCCVDEIKKIQTLLASTTTIRDNITIDEVVVKIKITLGVGQEHPPP